MERYASNTGSGHSVDVNYASLCIRYVKTSEYCVKIQRHSLDRLTRYARKDLARHSWPRHSIIEVSFSSSRLLTWFIGTCILQQVYELVVFLDIVAQ